MFGQKHQGILYNVFGFASHKLSELCVTHRHSFETIYPSVSTQLFPFFHNNFHSNLLRILDLCVKIHVPWDFGTYQVSTLNCSLGFAMEAHNTTKVRHRLSDIVDRY